MGISPRRKAATLASSLSTQTTSLPVSARQAPTTRPTYPVPTTAISKCSPPLVWAAADDARHERARAAANPGLEHRPGGGLPEGSSGRPSLAIIRQPMNFALDVRPALARPTGV